MTTKTERKIQRYVRASMLWGAAGHLAFVVALIAVDCAWPWRLAMVAAFALWRSDAECGAGDQALRNYEWRMANRQLGPDDLPDPETDA